MKKDEKGTVEDFAPTESLFGSRIHSLYCNKITNCVSVTATSPVGVVDNALDFYALIAGIQG